MLVPPLFLRTTNRFRLPRSSPSRTRERKNPPPHLLESSYSPLDLSFCFSAARSSVERGSSFSRTGIVSPYLFQRARSVISKESDRFFSPLPQKYKPKSTHLPPCSIAWTPPDQRFSYKGGKQYLPTFNSDLISAKKPPQLSRFDHPSGAPRCDEPLGGKKEGGKSVLPFPSLRAW